MYQSLFDALRDYLAGRSTVRDLDLEVATFDWDDDSEAGIALQPTARRLYLYTTEVIEGLRPEGDLLDAVGQILSESITYRVAEGSNVTGSDRTRPQNAAI